MYLDSFLNIYFSGILKVILISTYPHWDYQVIFIKEFYWNWAFQNWVWYNNSFSENSTIISKRTKEFLRIKYSSSEFSCVQLNFLASTNLYYIRIYLKGLKGNYIKRAHFYPI